jgi:hypothetical protein
MGSSWFAGRVGKGADRVQAPDTEVRWIDCGKRTDRMHDPHHTVVCQKTTIVVSDPRSRLLFPS